MSLSDAVYIMLINVKMPTMVGILTFMSRINFVLSWVEHEKSFITSGPDLQIKEVNADFFFHSWTKTYVVGTQKNHLNATQNTCEEYAYKCINITLFALQSAFPILSFFLRKNNINSEGQIMFLILN